MINRFKKGINQGWSFVILDKETYQMMSYMNDFKQFCNSDLSYVSKSGVRLFPYYLLAYIMPPLYKP